MSDLINFNSSNENVTVSLASPLIPPPEITNVDNLVDIDEAGPLNVSYKGRLSLDNNPFDLVMKKVIEFEKNKDDPIESICQKAMRCCDKIVIEPEDNLMLKLGKGKTKINSRFEDGQVGEKEKVISLGSSTNLWKDTVMKKTLESKDCDMYNKLPSISVSPAVYSSKDLSILSNSSMNDSLLELNHNSDEDFKLDLNIRERCKSQTDFLSPKKTNVKNSQRSMSVTESMRNSASEISSNNYDSQFSFDNMLNKAFTRVSNGSSRSLQSSNSRNSFFKNSQSDLSTNSTRVERINSDSSVFSLLSNVSSIQSDSVIKHKKDRFSDESSLSSISSLSHIPSNTGSSIFSIDTMDKGFLNSKTQLNSTNTTEIKSPVETKPHETVKSTTTKLVDVNDSNTSVFIEEPAVDNLISNEALILAKTFEKMAVNKEPQSSNSDDSLLLSKIQLDFDDLPPSDDENVDILIDLPSSPEQKKDEEIKNSKEDDIKEFEIERKDPDKKAKATLLLLNLQELLGENENPDTSKVLNDLQKLLGVQFHNNAEILEACLQSNIDITQYETKSECKTDLNETIDEHKNRIRNGSKDNNNKEDNKCQSMDEKTKHKKNVLKNNINKKSENSKKSDNPTEYENLAKNFLFTLNKIVSENNENSAVDFVKNLSSVLNLASDKKENSTKAKNSTSKLNRSLPLRSSTKTNTLSTPNTLIRTNSTLNVSRPLARTNSSLCSPRPVSRSNSSLSSPRPVSRSNSSLASPRPITRTNSTLSSPRPIVRTNSTLSATNISTKTNTSLNTSQLQEKRKSNMIKKRFSSDSELNKSGPEVTVEKNSKMMNQRSLTRSNTITLDPIKSKLKKTNSEIVQKKGPLKAVIPMGNMQKPVKTSSRLSVNISTKTPPKPLDSRPSLKLVSSTPNQNEILKKNNRLKPSASSTPNVANVGKRHLEIPDSKLNKATPKKTPSGLPKYSPRPVKFRNSSINDLQSGKSPESIKTNSVKIDTKGVKTPENKSNLKNFKSPMSDGKVSTENHIRRSVLSPNVKRIGDKGKSSSLSRLGKSASIQTALEKENYV